MRLRFASLLWVMIVLAGCNAPNLRVGPASCTNDQQCSTGMCVDGVCCRSRCDGVCERCDLPNSRGVCTPVSEGVDPDNECDPAAQAVSDAGSADAGRDGAPTDGTADGAPADANAADGALADGGTDGAAADAAADGGGRSDAATSDGGRVRSPCAGTCNGARACRFPGASQQCSSPSCAGGSSLTTAQCDGQGTCKPKTESCGNYACSDGACETACGSQMECNATTSFCNMNGNCVPKKPNGEPCVRSTDCRSGVCADNFCCATSCGAPLNCSATPGTCSCGTLVCTMGCRVIYRDADGDGYGDRNGTVPSTAQPACVESALPAGWVANNSDCDDRDTRVHPRAAGDPGPFYPTASTGGTFDYNCDGSLEEQYPEYPGSACRFCTLGSAGCNTSTSSSGSGDQAALRCDVGSNFFCTEGADCRCCNCRPFVLCVPRNPCPPAPPPLNSFGFTSNGNCGEPGNYVECGSASGAGQTPYTTVSYTRPRPCR